MINNDKLKKQLHVHPFRSNGPNGSRSHIWIPCPPHLSEVYGPGSLPHLQLSNDPKMENGWAAMEVMVIPSGHHGFQ